MPQTDKSSLPIIAIVGPTATGKTALSLHLAIELAALGLKSEVISADSRVVYRQLDIGTAKPTPEEQAVAPHWMIDVANPQDVYNVAQYQADATPHLERLLAQPDTVPIVVGGTGFYIRGLLQEEFLPPAPPNEAYRQAMEAWADSQAPDALHTLLKDKDPERAEALHPHDRFRVIRALEIIHHTGQPVPKTPTPKALNIHWIGLTYQDRDILRSIIDRRIDTMMAAGWLEEVAQLVAQYGPEAEALKVTHGYPELAQVLAGTRPMADALAQIRINIHQYSRRQMTWFRKNPAIHWHTLDHLPQQDLFAQILAELVPALRGVS